MACVSNPATPYAFFLVAAASAGLGGGNFASSMANISYFYPDAKKGAALGINAAGGNIGVSTVQLVVPAIVGISVFGAASAVNLENIALVWVPLSLLAAAGAWFCMDNLVSAKSPMADQLKAAGRPQTWVMSLLYVGTFGSFIGYGAAMPLLMKTQFPDVTGCTTRSSGRSSGRRSGPSADGSRTGPVARGSPPWCSSAWASAWSA